jgi:REP element-mobilizing transposase RayT
VCLRDTGLFPLRYSCKYSVVWYPKYRRPVPVNGIDAWLKDIIQTVCTECRTEVIKQYIENQKRV